jgi:hypothetical protein
MKKPALISALFAVSIVLWIAEELLVWRSQFRYDQLDLWFPIGIATSSTILIASRIRKFKSVCFAMVFPVAQLLVCFNSVVHGVVLLERRWDYGEIEFLDVLISANGACALILNIAGIIGIIGSSLLSSWRTSS